MLRRFAWMLIPAALAWAGGFFLTVHNEGNAITVAAEGCRDYSHAQITAQAVGLVNGRRRQIPLELTATGKGTYTVRKQWPKEGKWVLVFNGTYSNLHTHTLVELSADGQLHPRMYMRPVAAEEIEAALR